MLGLYPPQFRFRNRIIIRSPIPAPTHLCTKANRQRPENCRGYYLRPELPRNSLAPRHQRLPIHEEIGPNMKPGQTKIGSGQAGTIGRFSSASSPANTTAPYILNVSSQRHMCPHCKGRVERVRRRTFDRIVSWIIPVRRYRCRRKGWGCDWEGNLR
jgi:hypothetical protein